MPILSLPEARAALSLRDADDERDALIVEFCAGVDAVVEGYLGDWVVAREVTIDAPASGVLPGRSVVSVVSGEYRDGSGAVDVSGMYVTDAGILATSDGSALPSRPWRVTLEVGSDEVAAGIKRGAAEILVQAWATQRGGDAPPAFLVPYRAAAWLDPHALVGGFA